MKYLSETKQIPNITAIRFLLALLVVIYHIAQFSENREFPFFRITSYNVCYTKLLRILRTTVRVSSQLERCF